MNTKREIRRPAVKSLPRKAETILHKTTREANAKQISTSKILLVTTRTRTVEIQNLDPVRTQALMEKEPVVKEKTLVVKVKVPAAKAKAPVAKAANLEEVPQKDRKAPRSILRSSALLLRSQARSPMTMERTPTKVTPHCRKPYPAL